MLPNMSLVQSSMLKSIGYTAQTKTLFVCFNNGRTYKYLDVPVEQYDAMLSSDSIGKYLNANIKPNYTAEEVL